MRNNDIIKIAEILRDLGIDPDITSFDSRLRIQKTVFILKSMGISLDYPFEFYRGGHGVYSRKLANDYYNDRILLASKSPPSTLNEDEKAKLHQFKKIDYLNNKMLEAISSIIYLDLVYDFQEDVVAEIKPIKPHIGHDTVLLAQNLTKMLLFKEEYLTEDIVKEMQIWDALDDDSNYQP
ncbi:MAG: hypothetical protein M0Z77_08855 [Thermoplasmatales archaeon]|nr:hypothetical protein [Thermoplasmatales archaeon]